MHIALRFGILIKSWLGLGARHPKQTWGISTRQPMVRFLVESFLGNKFGNCFLQISFKFLWWKTTAFTSLATSDDHKGEIQVRRPAAEFPINKLRCVIEFYWLKTKRIWPYDFGIAKFSGNLPGNLLRHWFADVFELCRPSDVCTTHYNTILYCTIVFRCPF